MKTKLSLIVIVFIFGCGTSDHQQDCDTTIGISAKTKILGHKGSGPINSFQNEGWHENGRPSILNALRNLDGSEVDIQMSADSTLWLYHDHEIRQCNGEKLNIATLRDSTIEQINKCQYDNQLLTLTDFNMLLQEEKLHDKIISLDLKVLSNPAHQAQDQSDVLITYITQQIQKELKIKHLLLEVPFTISAMDVSERTNLKTYSVCYKSEQVKESMDYLSVPYNLLPVKVKTSELQTWTPNTAQDLISTLNHTPDYIQVDNVKLGAFIRSIRDGDKILQCVKDELFNVSTANNEFEPLVQDTVLPNQPMLYRITLDKRQNKEEQFVVLAITNKKGRVIKYTSHTLDQNLFHFFIDESTSYDGSSYSIYIWNKSKKPLSLKGRISALQ